MRIKQLSLLAGLALLFFSCKQETQSPPNIILIMTDDVSMKTLLQREILPCIKYLMQQVIIPVLLANFILEALILTDQKEILKYR